MSCSGSALRISGSGGMWSCNAIGLQFLLLFVHAVEFVLPMVVGSDGKRKTQHNDGLPFLGECMFSLLFDPRANKSDSKFFLFTGVDFGLRMRTILLRCLRWLARSSNTGHPRQTAPPVSCIRETEEVLVP